MTSVQITTLAILVSLWVLGGLRLLWSGSFMLISQPITGFLLIISIVVALTIGSAKGHFLLSKTAQRSLDNLKLLENKMANYFIGWLKVLGKRGLIMISLMIVLGIVLGNFLPPFGRGLLRITIGIALIIGSYHLSLGFKNSKNQFTN